MRDLIPNIHHDNRRLKVGLVLPQWNSTTQFFDVGPHDTHWSDIRVLARHAEAVGFDSLWVSDHFQVSETLGFWEGWSVLAAIAAVTTRVEIGPLVANTGYRNPALLARTADTIDDISEGRLILGLGAGDVQDEHVYYGFQWDHRVSRFEEALQIIQPMLRTGGVDFRGEYYAAEHAVLNPRGPRASGPPLLIGALGQGPRVLRLTMEYADIWNAWLVHGDSTAQALIPILHHIDTACEIHQRDPATLERSVVIGVSAPGRLYLDGMPNVRPLSGTPAELAEQLYAFVELGMSHLILMLDPLTSESVDYVAPVLETLRNS